MSLNKQADDYDDMTGHHQSGEGYSDRSKVPTISHVWEKQKRMISQRKDEAQDLGQELSDGAKEKADAMEKATQGKEKPAKAFKVKGEREVLDPVTGRRVVIKDAELKDCNDAKLFSTAALDPGTSEGGPATHAVPESGQGLNVDNSTKHISPHPIEPSNVLLQQFPPPYDKDTLSAILGILASTSHGVVAALGVVWVFTAFRAGWFAFTFRTTLIGATAFAVYAAYGIVGRKLEKELERVRLDLLKQRADKFSPPTPESAEWLNALTKTIWPLVNPSMFQSLVDMIEDVMQASLPSMIDAVKVEDFTIGKNALRIVAMRGLPDQPASKNYPQEEWIDQGSTEFSLDSKRKGAASKKDDAAEGAETDSSGDYVNLEVSFAYFAPPGTKKLQGKNISLIINFLFGVWDWCHIPVPIWIAVETIVGTVRLRIQIVPDPPFVRNITFTLMGVPKIEASAIPLAKILPNVLDLPLVSGFVQSSIAAACSVYCAPHSMTLNVGQILSGDGIKKDTKALGILAITIHFAEELSAQDDNGFSDPYVVLAYSKLGKPLFSTRIITHDLNPVWEQTAYLIVSDDEIRAQESLSVQLWDSDKLSADDLVGRIKVPLVELMTTPNQVHERKDTLMGFEDADSMSGTLSWSVAYYDKATLNPALKKTPGIDHSLPKELQDRPELKVQGAAIDTAEEADVRSTPPDPCYPAGVLSVIVHQVNSLERRNLSGATGKNREGQAGQDTDDPTEETSNIPSAYCEIILDDDLVYKTRTKQYSSMPFFEAGTERFIRNWKETTLRVVVRDARLREHDPILGIVNLPLAEVLASASEVTKLWAIEDGVGFGRVSISILFKGIQIDLPRNLSGWDTGTVCVTSAIRVEPVPDSGFGDFKEKKLFVSTLEARQKLPGSSASVSADGTLEYAVDEHVRLPTYNRYASAVFFDYGGGIQLGAVGKKYEAFASLWLKDLVDNESQEIRIPIVVTKESGGALRQNYISAQTEKTHKYKVVGWLITTVHLDSGLDEDHEQYAATQTQRHEFEVYDRIEGQSQSAVKNSHANDDGVIDRKEQKDIDKAHQKALESRERGVMQFRPARTAKWVKDGIKDRAGNIKAKLTGGSKKEETVATEAGDGE